MPPKPSKEDQIIAMLRQIIEMLQQIQAALGRQ